MTQILVTGGAGYVGSVSVERLLEAGHDVAVLDDLSTGHAGSVPSGARLFRGSYADRELMAAAIRAQGTEAVLHCAARSLVADSIADPAAYYRANVAGGLTLLETMRELGVGRIVLSSTAAVYGVPDPGAASITEDAPLRPINPYGETKRTLETAIAWYGRAYGLRSASLRYFNVAGATLLNGEDHDPESHLIPNVLRAAREGSPVMLFGDDYATPDGTCIRDYIHVADLGDAHLLALEATAPGDARTDEPLVCNLGNGDGFSVREVLAAAERVVGRAIPHTIGPRRAGDAPVLVASAARAASILGWSPRRPEIESMIGSAWDWLNRHPDGYGDRG
jgi:UDP-glucose-4-epimerase GalE